MRKLCIDLARFVGRSALSLLESGLRKHCCLAIPDRRAFVQHYDSDVLDASLLLMPCASSSRPPTRAGSPRSIAVKKVLTRRVGRQGRTTHHCDAGTYLDRHCKRGSHRVSASTTTARSSTAIRSPSRWSGRQCATCSWARTGRRRTRRSAAASRVSGRRHVVVLLDGGRTTTCWTLPKKT